MFLPGLLGQHGLPRHPGLPLPPPPQAGFVTGLNPALMSQLQQIQRLHAENSRLIGKSLSWTFVIQSETNSGEPTLSMALNGGRFDAMRAAPRFPLTGKRT